MAKEKNRSGCLSLVVHGGAGEIPEDERPAHRAGLARALEAGWELLDAGRSALDAVEAAVRALEDDPAFDAGVGSILRLDGSVSLDASVMEGTTRRAGAVAGLSRVRHPVTLARRVLEKTPHVFFIASGAEALAEREGLELCDPSFFVTGRERRRLERILEVRGGRGRGEPGEGVPFPGGTVGAVARDREGRLAAATSTGGAPGTPPGRVGDTPVIGAGTYADDRHGAVSCTGRGEPILRVTLAREVVRQLAAGRDAPSTARWATEYLAAEGRGRGGVICVDRLGAVGAAYNTAWMGSDARQGPA